MNKLDTDYMITKVFNHKKLSNYNEYSGLRNIIGINKEVQCLTDFNKSYKTNRCICGRGHHFPIILEYIPNSVLKMTHEGIDLRKIRNTKLIIRIPDAKLQILCILNTLKYNKIEHLDINETGKNICVDNNGKISLIDFDIVFMKNYENENKLNKLMKNRLNRFRKYNTFNRIYQILNKCPNLILI